jgi:hyperosmotically inducible periplasmic protein
MKHSPILTTLFNHQSKFDFMRKSFLRFAFICTATAMVAVSMPSCKGGVKDADIEKAITEKVAAMPEAAGVTSTVKDGVVTLAGEFKDDVSKAGFETALKAIPGVKSVMNNATIAAPPPAPAPAPVVSADDPLIKAVTDATKDFPGVKADVKDGVITLTGEIKKASLPKLMMALNTLKPKKIENKLTTK